MESLAYLELALVCEAPAESKIFDGPKWQNLSSQTYVRLLSLALMLSVLSAASSAFAQIDPGNPNLRSVQDRLRDLGSRLFSQIFHRSARPGYSTSSD